MAISNAMICRPRHSDDFLGATPRRRTKTTAPAGFPARAQHLFWVAQQACALMEESSFSEPFSPRREEL